MAKVAVTHPINGSADAVWAVIGGFHTLPAWHPAIRKSVPSHSGNDIVRSLHLPDGGIVVERLEALHNNGHTYTYSILEAPMPVANYVATIRVLEDGNGASSVVQWVATFDVTSGDEQDVVRFVQGVFNAGLDQLETMFPR